MKWSKHWLKDQDIRVNILNAEINFMLYICFKYRADKIKGWKVYANINLKKDWGAILLSTKVEFRKNINIAKDIVVCIKVIKIV